jgi:peptide/nickel transport system substrate-binding protein
MTRISLVAALALAGLATMPRTAALARDLVMGASTEPSAIDPHFSRSSNNQNIAAQIFDRLVTLDANLQLKPMLAESWQNLDPLTWRIKLRAGVVFQDGASLTPEDVIFSMERAKDIPNSPAPFTGNVGAIAAMVAVDPLTIEVKTKSPTPDLMDQIGLVYIVEKKRAEGKRLDAFAKGEAAIGTGPFRFKEWVPGDHITLERNERYWGEKPAFETVTIKLITNNAARVAALRTGAVQLIDAVPPSDIKALSAMKEVRLFSIASSRIIYLALDTERDASPFVTGTDGQPAKSNPLKNPNVRLALSRMINRKAIVERLLDGAGEPAGQIVPEGLGGYDPALKPEIYDPKGARALLAAAGYPQGFGLTLHSSNDRFSGDGLVAQTLGQMFAQGGIKINGVVTQPYNVYAGAAGKQSFSAFIFSLGTVSPTSATSLRNLLMTVDKEGGQGGFNRSRYSNPAFDAKMKTAMAEFDPVKRNALLAEATALAMNDTALIPLYWPIVTWASRSDITYTANRGEDFQADYAGIAPR